ncbi:hypothetical protein [Streptomyces sp. NPDC058297]|uniref:hypothetical protein n=1 Tax=Streptomyces sp. NPDC058297 TaxID=3346433 RepID=UPI0036F023FB
MRHARRVHGCVWALLVPCFLPVFLFVLVGYPVARSARSKARQIFPARGRRRIEDPHVTRVQKARAWTATVMSALILIVYGKPGDMAQTQEQFMFRLVVTPWLLILSAPLIVALLYRWAAPAAKVTMRVHLRSARRSALWYFGAFSLVPVFAVGASFAEQFVGAALGSWLMIVLLAPMFWVLIFVVFSTGPAISSAFNTAEVHAALPALLTGVLVWEFAFIGLVSGGLPPGPPVVQICAFLGGPASVTAVAWWEITRLRTRYGVSLRG